MAEIIKGDLSVLRSIQAGRRVNETGFTQALIGSLVLDKYAYGWYNLTAAAPQDVILPDATTLIEGWQVVINNKDTTNALTVKDGGAGATVKSIVAGRAYRLTCTSIGAAAGTWHVDFLEESDLLVSSRYSTTFNATTDWGAAAGGYYTYTLTQATHLRGTTPTIIVEQVDGSDFDTVVCDQVKVLANGDVALRVTEVPDGRFSGRITLV
jgi:hypothetical protein